MLFEKNVNSRRVEIVEGFQLSNLICVQNENPGEGVPGEVVGGDANSVEEIRKRLAKIKQAAF